MRLLPIDRVTLRTTSPPEVVEAKLRALIAAPRLFGRPAEPFRGWIEGRHFKITRVLGTFLGLPYRNSWQPVIIGDIAPTAEGTEIRARMRLQTFVGVFTAVWFGFLVCFVGAMLWAAATQGFGPSIGRDGRAQGGAGVGLAVAFGMGLFAYSLVRVSFWSEVRKAKAALREGLGCSEIEGHRSLVR